MGQISKTVRWGQFSTLAPADKVEAWAEKVNEDLNREYGARFADLPPDLIPLLCEFRIRPPLAFARLPMDSKDALAQNHGEAILWAMHKYYPFIFGQKIKGDRGYEPGLMALLADYFDKYDGIDRFLLMSDFRGMTLCEALQYHKDTPGDGTRHIDTDVFEKRIERYFLDTGCLHSLRPKLSGSS